MAEHPHTAPSPVSRRRFLTASGRALAGGAFSFFGLIAAPGLNGRYAGAPGYQGSC